MKKTYQGSCHCGKVRYEAELDLSEGTGKCNCSICTNTRNWSAIVRPADFRLLTSETELRDYQFASHSMHHVVCKTCGVRSFGHGFVEEIGGAFYSVNVACLDNFDPAELISGPTRYADGRNNNWRETPAETRHL